MFKIAATQQEIDMLRQLLHRAVLHSGMQVAEAAVLWDHKLNVAVAAGKPDDKPDNLHVVREGGK